MSRLACIRKVLASILEWYTVYITSLMISVVFLTPFRPSYWTGPCDILLRIKGPWTFDYIRRNGIGVTLVALMQGCRIYRLNTLFV
jgi:hypothetical protein